MRRLMTLAGLLLATTTTVAAQEASSREIFLREAEVVGAETLAGGVTRSERLELERNGVPRRALFKSVDIYLPNQNVRIGEEVQKGIHDTWKFEVAAYELDKLLGLGMVPTTVARNIDGREGALIDWIDDILPEFTTSAESFDTDAWENEVAKAWLFDYLAYNIDRTTGNLLVTKGFKIRLIDHSRAFQRLLVPMRPLFRFPRGVITRLRGLGEQDFHDALGAFLDDEEMDALLERRKRVLRTVDQLLASHTAAEVFF